ncbi:MAG: hypothetical protein GX777_09685 [Fastidiosipila sp.]|nr:hypothetical protein [Fastidiosipila sp.]
MKKDKHINIFKKEDGAGLVLALMVLMVLAVLGVAVAGVTIGSHKLGDISRDSNSAYYIAEAGANLAYDEIESGVLGKYAESSSDSIFYSSIDALVSAFNNPETLYGAEVFSEQFGDQPQAKVNVISDNSAIDPLVGKEYKIISEGMISGKTRTVEKTFIVKWVSKGGGIGLPEPPEGAALVGGREIKGKTKDKIIEGNVYLSGGATTFLQNNDIKGTIYKNWSGMEQYMKLINYFPKLPSNYKTYPSTFSGNTISESSYIPTQTTTNLLTINTTYGEILNLVVDDLIVNGNIKIIGSGIVNLYVTTSMQFTKAATINDGSTPQEIERLNILYSGPNNITFDLKMVFNGSLFVENKNVKLTFNNHVTASGLFLFFGKEIDFGNMPNAITEASIYAPNAFVKFDPHGDVRGSIIADSIELTNQSKVTYKKNDFIETYLFGDGSGGPGGPGTGTGPGTGEEVIEGNLITAGPALEP